MDADIVHNQSSVNVSKLYAFLKSIDAIYRRPDDKIIVPKIEDFSEKGHALLSTRLGPLDVLAFIEQGKTYEDLLENSVKIEFRGHTIHVLDIKTMIEIKKDSKDPKDMRRLPVLEETLRQLEKDLGINANATNINNSKSAEPDISADAKGHGTSAKAP